MPELPELPPVASDPVSVVLIGRGAEDVAGEVVRDWAAFLDAREASYEILFVDDGGGDGAAEAVAALAEEDPRVRLLRHESPRGEGAALRAGLSAAALPLVAYAPCDPDYRPEYLLALLGEIDRVHLVSAYRAGRRVHWPWRVTGWFTRLVLRVVFSYPSRPLPGWLGWRGHLWRWVGRVFFGVRLRDVACPFRLMRREILPRAPVQSLSPFAHIELLAKVNFLGHVLAEEVPVDVKAPLGPPPSEVRRQMRKDALAVFRDPDFGPARLPEAAPPPAADAGCEPDAALPEHESSGR